MAKNLVIVESPAKAKTIEKFLGKDYKVESSFGHIADLPSKELGVDVDNDFMPKYIVDKDKQALVKKLKELSKKASTIWLASDEDREGEAISWHLAETLELDKSKTKRIVFNSITKSAIQKAIENPREINYNLVNAQQARRVLDRLVGYELSPVLWKKIKPGLSAGRVQSVAVRLIVEREREIEGFTPEASFKVSAAFKTGDGSEFIAKLNKAFSTKGEAETFLKKNLGASFKVGELDKKPAKKSPSAPFHDLYPATGGLQKTLFFCGQDHAGGATPLRGRFDYLYEDRQREPLGGGYSCGQRSHYRKLRQGV